MKRSKLWLGAVLFAVVVAVVCWTWMGTGVNHSLRTAGQNGGATASDPQPGKQAFAIRGVIEGFYGSPWTQQQRLAMLGFLANAHFNTYVYAPKDDPYQRDQWAELYPSERAAQMQQLVQVAADHGVRFVYSISPGKPAPLPGKPNTPELETRSITYSSSADRSKLETKIDQLRSIGVHTFLLSFDDVQDGMKSADQRRYNNDLAFAQADLANEILQKEKVQDAKFELWFAPTVYHGLKDNPYWQTLKDHLAPSIQVIWTGSSILAQSITSVQADQVAQLLGRKPLVWDNYPVNDYTYEIKKQPQLFLGPLEGRSSDLGDHVAGLLANPMIQPEASKIPLYTVGMYLNDPQHYSPEDAWRQSFRQLCKNKREADLLESFAQYAVNSTLRDEPNLNFVALQDAYWNQDGALQQEAERKLRAELRKLHDMPTAMQQLSDHELLTEIDPWLKKLGGEGEAGLLALDMLDLDKSDAKRADLHDQLAAKVQVLRLDPTKIGDEILGFLDQALAQ